MEHLFFFGGCFILEHIILHSDLNNFFASVEAVKNPLLRGKCFAVAGDPEKRSGAGDHAVRPG